MLDFLAKLDRQEKQLDRLLPAAGDRASDSAAVESDPWIHEPLPLAVFMSDVMGLPLWPVQQQDLESFLGSTVEDTKALFTQEPPTSHNCGALIWGKGCLGPNECLTDMATGQTKTVKEWSSLGNSLLVKSWDGDRVVLRWTSPVYCKGAATLYKVTLNDGRSFMATAKHQCLSPAGWRPLDTFQVGRTRLLTTPLDSNAQTVCWQLDNQACEADENLFVSADGLRDRCIHESLLRQETESSKAFRGLPFFAQDFFFEPFHIGWTSSPTNNEENDDQIIQDFLSDYRFSPHSYGEQLRKAQGDGLELFPLRADALLHNRCCLHEGGYQAAPLQVHSQTCLPFSPHWEDISHRVGRGGAFSPPFELTACVSFLLNTQIVGAIPFEWSLACTNQPFQVNAPWESGTALFSAKQSPPQSFPHFSEIIDVKELEESEYYDLTVSGTHCYFDSQGICHHNSGKDLVSSAMLCWFIHILFCLRSPRDFLELESSEAIDIALASPTLRQTRRITFAKLKNRLKGWTWLKDRLRENGIDDPDKYLKKATEAADFIELPHNIRIHNIPLIAASAEGFNMLAFVLSEFAAMESDATSETAGEVLNSFMSSGKTRFRRAWKGFLASFPRSLSDPQEKIVEQYEQGLFPELFVVRRPTWEVHPNRKFEDFASDFERDPEGSWAKYGAQPRAAVESYFRSPDLIVRHASGGDFSLFQKHFKHRTEAQQRWLAGRVPSPISDRDLIGDVVLNAYGFPRLHEWFRGKPGAEYWAHVDIGISNDSTGFAIGHLEDTGAGYLPVVDLSFRWKAVHFAKFGEIRRFMWRYDRAAQQFTYGDEYTENIQAAEIDLKTVTDFVLWLKAKRGFEFAGFSCDGFNSAQLLQTLLQFDIPVSLHTVDKSDYDELKGSIYTRQVQYWCDRPLFHELSKLIIKGNKVEAPRTKTDSESTKTDSHKDEADAIARVVSVLNRLVAVQTDFIQLPEADEELDQRQDQPVEQAVSVSGDFSESQEMLLKEFFQ